MSVQVEASRRIKVLIIDDSALVRSLLTRILGADRELEVVGTAPDAFVAREKIKLLQPDVLTLDVEMPRMDGLQFLRNLMRLRPMPVVMCSSITERGADVTLAALELGAVDFVTKPKLDVAHLLETYAAELITKVKSAAVARVRPFCGPLTPVSSGAVVPAARAEARA
ncbi:MAG: response regulator, partial [Steroidobacteraceae bacterium]